MTKISIKSYNKPHSRSRGRGRGWYEKAVYVQDAGKRVAPRHREVALRGHHSRPRPAPSSSHYSRQLMSRGKIDISRHKSPAMLMTKEMERKIPPLYSTEDKKPEDITVYTHYFTPFSNWDWYITEYDGKDTMFGLVKGHDVELGYISLSELKSQGANVERDLYFGELSLAEVMEKTGYRNRLSSSDIHPGEYIYAKMGSNLPEKHAYVLEKQGSELKISYVPKGARQAVTAHIDEKYCRKAE
jgi:hypothetical protein